MSDLSRLLEDVYRPTTTDVTLEEVFADWVAEAAPVAEPEDQLQALLDQALQLAPDIIEVDDDPEILPSGEEIATPGSLSAPQNAVVVLPERIWCRTDDDILPTRRPRRHLSLRR